MTTSERPGVTVAEQQASLLVDAKEAAGLCGVSVSGWYNLVVGGKTPKSVRLGRSVKWRRAELEAWIDADCPAREVWETRKARK